MRTFPPHKAPSEGKGSQTDIQMPQIHLADNIWAAEMFGLPSASPSYLFYSWNNRVKQQELCRVQRILKTGQQR